ncbi:tRNA-dihydrouridine(16) synthase [Arenicella chitinivorans]|uniref:tRNA-dihydrouridine(16) synthase n=1 Tax=Arenicella chitinivorans TaxID=1329800 RepID=A0A918RLA0_9GAMM|nr:tRNA-dihydrouridine synthase [Arenicella chitinivorans]GHA02571.1 tRNA-dihydrouridine(16) synthase [Arenicella chitinivorans]
MQTILAPMEGVIDAEMRALLTSLGGFDRCVTEFVRVTEQRLPAKVFLRYAPELEQGGVTPSGVPVYLQLLGGNPRAMAFNAQRVAKLEPAGIDLNFGCPSKTVNRSDGGSILLREPQRVFDIVKAVRDAVDPSIPVTAKIRLGFSNADHLLEIAHNIAVAGANELCIHARTREDRYKPPAYWHLVKPVQRTHCLPITINGEIWSVEDALQARAVSGCTGVMLGRGVLRFPQLAAQLRAYDLGQGFEEFDWFGLQSRITDYLNSTQKRHKYFVGGRAKQWLGFLLRRYPQAGELFHRIKRLRFADEVLAEFDAFAAESKTTGYATVKTGPEPHAMELVKP